MSGLSNVRSLPHHTSNLLLLGKEGQPGAVLLIVGRGMVLVRGEGLGGVEGPGSPAVWQGVQCVICRVGRAAGSLACSCNRMYE